MNGYKYLHARLSNLHDEQVLELLRELELVCGVAIEANSSWYLLHYLTQCIYPNGGPEAVLISKDDLDERDPINGFLLRKKIKNLTQSEIYSLCQEIAANFKEGIERHEGKSLYVFINHFFQILKKKRPPAGKRRWLA